MKAAVLYVPKDVRIEEIEKPELENEEVGGLDYLQKRFGLTAENIVEQAQKLANR